MEAARRIDEWQVLSKRIPSTRLVPVFTQKSSNTSVSFTPQEWALICKIDERRSIEEIAVGLGMSPFETCKILYGLITSGLVELKEDLTKLHTDRLQRMSPTDLSGSPTRSTSRRASCSATTTSRTSSRPSIGSRAPSSTPAAGSTPSST